MTREDALYFEYRAAEARALDAEHERSIATSCVACGAPLNGSPHYDDHGAICFTCAEKEKPPIMTVPDALREAARLARGRADYFQKRAGHGNTKHVPVATNEIERARFERDAIAFEQAAEAIEELAAGGYHP